MDVPVPGYGDPRRQPGLVDVGSGGRVQEGEEGRQAGDEELLQEAPLSDR